MNQYSSDVERLLYQNFIKYDRLYYMTHHTFHSQSDVNHIAIYIDMPSLTNVLYGMIDQYTAADAYAVSAVMVNLCAHLRSYFATRHRVSTEFYIVYGKNMTQSAIDIYPEYNAHRAMDHSVKVDVSKLISQNVDVLKIICPYLPDINFVDAGQMDVAIVMADLIQYNNAKYNTVMTNIIYSKDTYAYQLVAYMPMTFLYRPFKNSDDVSWVVNKSSLYWAYKTELKSKTADMPVEISAALFALVLGFSGLRSRNIASGFNINSSIHRITRVVNANILSNGVNGVYWYISEDKSFTDVERINTAFGINEKIYKDTVRQTTTIFLPWHLEKYQKTVECGLSKNIITNLSDPNTVRSINDTYFRATPLDLERI